MQSTQQEQPQQQTTTVEPETQIKIENNETTQSIPFKDGQIVWAKQIGFPYWPAIFIDTSLLSKEKQEFIENKRPSDCDNCFVVKYFSDINEIGYVPEERIKTFKSSFEDVCATEPFKIDKWVTAVENAIDKLNATEKDELKRKFINKVDEYNKLKKPKAPKTVPEKKKKVVAEMYVKPDEMTISPLTLQIKIDRVSNDEIISLFNKIENE